MLFKLLFIRFGDKARGDTENTAGRIKTSEKSFCFFADSLYLQRLNSLLILATIIHQAVQCFAHCANVSF